MLPSVVCKNSPAHLLLFILLILTLNTVPVLGQPVVSQGGVLNAADYSSSIAAGSMVAIFGNNLASGYHVATDVPLPFEIAGVRIDVIDGNNTRPAAIWFISGTQINAQLPFNLESSTVQLRVYRGGLPSAPVPVTISHCGPGFYTWTGTGSGEVAALHAADWTMVNEGSPAVPGEYLILYATGLGPVSDTPPITGQPGGDNQGWGPLNYATSQVRVTIGGENAPVVFAGLAPGFVGLYQINVQVPEGIGAGDHPILVQAGGAASNGAAELPVMAGGSGGDGNEPADVVRRAMEAQVRGDVDGFLAECITDGHDAEDLAVTRELLTLVRDYTTLTGFQFTALATGMGDQGTMAIVRALVEVTVSASDGTTEFQQGSLAYLQKKDGVWKILNLVPDDLLNQEIYESAEAEAAQANGLPRRYAGFAINLEDFNRSLNELLNTSTVDEVALARSISFGVVGQAPIFGDTLANINQVVEIVENTGGGLYETYKNGLTAVAVLKFKQVGVGVLQIVMEPVPGLDAVPDAAQAALEQAAHNLERTRALYKLQSQLRRLGATDVQMNPRLYPYPGYRFKYPAGIEMDAMPDPPQHAYGVPLEVIRVTAPTALDRCVPLMVVGEIPVEAASITGDLARQFGGQERGGIVYFPVEVGYLVQGDASNGDAIFDGYNRYRTEDSVSRVVTWHVTCRRGSQSVKVRLRNGETTPEVFVYNEFMNAVDTLQVSPLEDGEIELELGESVSGLRVVGTGSMLEPRFQPNLTSRSECLDMAIADTDVATLSRGQTLTVSAGTPGETELRLLLGGSASSLISAPDVEGSVPVRVLGTAGVLFDESWTQKFYNDWWQTNVAVRISTVGTATIVRDMMAGSIRYIEIEGKRNAEYNVEVNISGVQSVEEDPRPIRYFGQWDHGSVGGPGPKISGSNFTTTVEVPDGPANSITRASVVFNIRVDRKSDDIWYNDVATGGLLYVDFVGRD